MKKILAFTGSNHSQSINQQMLTISASKIVENEVTLIDLNDYPLPIYSLDIEAKGIPEHVINLRNILAEHDALMIATPEHNGSMPAFLKNVIDWLSRVVEPGMGFFGVKDKPVLLLSTSPGATGGATNLKNMAELMPWWGADVKGIYSLGSYHDQFVDGQLIEETDLQLTTIINQFESTL